MNKFENNSIDSEDVIDFTVYLKVIQRAKWRIIGFSVVITLLTIMFALTLVPQYTASATLLIESEQSKAVSFEEIYGLDTTKKEYYLTQFEILKSDSIGREVITKLNLEEHSDFIPKPSLMGEVKGYVKGLLPFLNKNEERYLSAEEKAEQKMLFLLSIYKSKLGIEPISNTQLVNISFESSDPTLAALVANAVGDRYIESQMRAKMGITQQASSWLNSRLSQLRIQLDDSEKRLQDFREDQHLIDIEGIAGLATQELEQISAQLIEARNEKNKLESINRVITEYGNNNLELLGSMPEITSHNVIQNVKRDVVTVERKLSELSEVYGPKHPKIISASAELITVKNNLNKIVYF